MNRGLTLIEVLIAMAILSSIILVVSFFGLDIFKLQLFLGETFKMQQEISLTLTNMGIEMRAMGPSANGSYPIEAASSKSFTFFSDVDGNGSFERVRYFISNSNLKRGIVEPVGNPAVYNSGTEISNDVVYDVILPPIASQSMFVYYDQDYTGTQAPLASPVDVNRIRLLKVTITADHTPQDKKNRVDYSATMLIRNLHNVQ